MPKQAVVKKNYPKKKPALLVLFILAVVKAMTNNEYFLKPAVALDVLTKSADDLQEIYINRKNGLNAKELLKVTLANTVALVDEQAEYVSDIAEGKTVVITSAGFEPTKTTNTKSVPPQTPKAPVPENVNGELRVTTETVDGATSYCWIVFIGEAFPLNITNSQIDIDPKAKVIVLPAGSTRECVRGLTRGMQVTVQVLAQNSAGKSGLSTAVSIGIA